jgi:hypothetical protein
LLLVYPEQRTSSRRLSWPVSCHEQTSGRRTEVRYRPQC